MKYRPPQIGGRDANRPRAPVTVAPASVRRPWERGAVLVRMTLLEWLLAGHRAPSHGRRPPCGSTRRTSACATAPRSATVTRFGLLC